MPTDKFHPPEQEKQIMIKIHLKQNFESHIRKFKIHEAAILEGSHRACVTSTVRQGLSLIHSPASH